MANLGGKFSPANLLNMREAGRKSLYYFGAGLCQNDWLDPALHLGLCNALQGVGTYENWVRLCICGFRGTLKSTVVQMWMLWKGLYNVDWSCLLVEQRDENAETHHAKLQNLLKYGPASALLQEMFSDRLPSGFEGWTTKKTILVRESPNADVFLTHAGLDSKLESKHKDAIVVDDPEGADANKSDVPNAEAERFVFNRAVPLMRDPNESQIVVVGTPHGKAPLVYKWRRLEANGSTNPEDRKHWHLWWKPVRNNDGTMTWPVRNGKRAYDEEWLRQQEAAAALSDEAREMLDTQYHLKEHSSAKQSFDMDVIQANAYQVTGSLIRYLTHKYAAPTKSNNYQILVDQKATHVDIKHCYRFLHIDPLHRGSDQRRNKPRYEQKSQWGMTVTAIAHDMHAFVVDEWVSEESIDVALIKMFELYRRWAPKAVTFEAIGAQVWLQSHVETLERGRFHNLMTIPGPGGRPERLPRLSSRMEEAHKGIADKSEWIIKQLELPHNLGLLHLNRDRTPVLWAQHESFGAGNDPIDLVDSLAQGPGVWRPPLSPSARDRLNFAAYMRKLKQGLDSTRLYETPWSKRGAA